LLDWLKQLRVEPYLKEAPFEELCGDVVMDSAAPNVGHIDSICTEPLDLNLISSPFLYHYPSHLLASHESLGDIRGSHLSLDLYCA